MKTITVVEPLFVSAFQCIGNECRDHCCKGWDIILDKSTVNRYLKSSIIEIKNLATENIITTKKSHANWGVMKLNAFGNCAFMDEHRLCKVHSSLGADALSNTCASYPRMVRTFKYEQQKKLVISCPEAARQLLMLPNAMLFEHTSVMQSGPNNAKDINQEKKLLNLMCLNLVKSSGVNLNESFYSLVLLMMGVEKLTTSTNRVERMNHDFSQVLYSLEQGEIRKQLGQIKADYNLQWSLLMRLQSWLSTRKDKRGHTTLNHYVNKLIYIQAEGAKTNNVSQPMMRLDECWKNKVIPWLAERPWVLNNYIQYRIYDEFFPNDESRSPLMSLYLLTAEWFLIKSLIAANVEFVGEVIEDDIINIIYSFHSVTKHNAESVKAFLSEIDKVKVNDNLSLIYLLK